MAGRARAAAAVEATSPRIDRDPLERDGPGVGAGEQQEVVDHRGQVIHLVADVGQGAAHAGDGLRRVPSQVVDARPDHGQRRTQFVRGVGREFALAAKRLALVDERAAERDEGSTRIDSADARRRQQRNQAADHEDDDEDPQRSLLGRPVADDLEVVRLAPEPDRVREDADRGRHGGLLDLARRDHGRLDAARGHHAHHGGRDRRRADVAPTGRLGRVERLHDRQARRHAPPAARSDRDAIAIDDHREDARIGATEDEPARRNVATRVRPSTREDPGLRHELRVPCALRDRSTAVYRIAPRTTSTASVMPPLHKARLMRTRRSNCASAGVTSGAEWSAGSGAMTPSGIREAVPHAANGLDEPSRGAKLVAQVVDVGIDRVRRHRDPERPRLVEQLIARQGLAGVPEQAFEQGELAWAELHAGAFDGDPPGGLVEHDRADDELGLRPAACRCAAARESPEPCRQLLEGERLDEVVVRSRVEPGDPVADRVAGCEHEGLKGKTALITGSSRGIGRGMAQRFAAEGANVAINYFGSAAAAEETLAESMTAAGARGVLLRADVSSAAEVTRLVADAVAEFGQLNLLVNNAGIEVHAPFWEVTEADYDKVIDLNVKGAFFATQALVRHLQATHRPGRIHQHQLGPRREGVPELRWACGSKGAMRMLARNLAVELGPLGITINNIAPGAIETPINTKLLNDPGQARVAAAPNPAPAGSDNRPTSPPSPSSWPRMKPLMSPARPSSSMAG